MALKNSLKSIGNRLFEIGLFNIASNKFEYAHIFSRVKNNANEIDLKEYNDSIKS